MVLLVILQSSGGRSFAQDDLVDVSDFILAGDAVLMDEHCVRLTPAYDWAGGSAWYRDPIDLSSSFSMEMDLMFGCNDVVGADGIVFVFTPMQGTTGYQGEGMGFAGLRPSLGIEIDTWENDHLDDPVEDHIAILQHGFVHHGYNLEGPVVVGNVEDCQLHKLGIYWDKDQHKISVMLDGREVIGYQGDIVEEVFYGDPQLYWGVTAATGRYNNRHEICFRKLEFSTPIASFRFHPREVKLLLKGNVTPLDVAFGKGNTTLEKNQEAELNKVINLLQKNPLYEIDIDGHSDELTNSDSNRELSLRRVTSIKDYLLKNGITSRRIHINGFGDRYPVSDQNQFLKNTRIEIRLYNPRT